MEPVLLLAAAPLQRLRLKSTAKRLPSSSKHELHGRVGCNHTSSPQTLVLGSSLVEGTGRTHAAAQALLISLLAQVNLSWQTAQLGMLHFILPFSSYGWSWSRVGLPCPTSTLCCRPLLVPTSWARALPLPTLPSDGPVLVQKGQYVYCCVPLTRVVCSMVRVQLCSARRVGAPFKQYLLST